MKTTKSMVDDQWEEIYQRERALIDAEKQLKEKELMQELFEEEMREKEKGQKQNKKARIILGRPRKGNRFADYARVKTSRKLPRFIKYFQYKHRGI